MSDEGLPPDPMTQLAQGATSAHEVFLSYVNAGFTRQEALAIVIAIVTACIPPSA